MKDNKLDKVDFILGIIYTTLITFMCVFKIPSIISTSISIFLACFLYLKLSKKITFDFFLISMLIYTLPFSFISIVGDSFFSLFIFIQIIFTIRMFLNGRQYKSNQLVNIITLISLAYILCVYFIHQSYYFKYYFENIVKIILFITIILISSTKFKTNNNEIDQLLKIYVICGFISGLAVFIQYLFFKYFGVTDIGTQNKMGETRLGFAGLFFDYSISSIYIASAALIVIYEKLRGKVMFTYNVDIILILMLISFSALTSARSGIASLFLVFCILLIYFKKLKLIIISALLAFPIFQIVLIIFEQNRGTSLSNDSGRLSNYQEAFSYIENNFFLGAKFLGYTELTNQMLPHNFILDFLVQYGFIFSLILMLIIFLILRKSLKERPILCFLFLLMIVGGNFHASFINTHYIIIPIILILSCHNGSLSRN